MSALLETLLEDQQRLRRAADKVAPPPVVSRADRIIAEGHAKRCAYGRMNPSADTAMVYGAQIGYLHGHVRKLCAEVEALTIRRDPDLKYVAVSDDQLGDDVIVGYAYEPETPDRVTSAYVLEKFGDPGEPGMAEVFDMQEVWVNGAELFAVLRQEVLDRISDKALEKARVAA